MKYLLRGIALAVTAVTMIALVSRAGQGRYIVLVAGYHTPVASPTATPSGCFTIPGTSTGAGATCFARTSCPSQTFAHDPIASGADSTGVNDSSGAISTAIGLGVTQGGHGDIHFGTPGTYLVNLTTGGTYVTANGIVLPANASLECSAGVTLKTNIGASPSRNGATIALQNGGNTVCGCDFQGAQTGNGPFQILNTSLNWSNIDVAGGSTYTIEGNTFERPGGNASITTYDYITGTGLPGPSNLTISFNSFTSQPYYGLVLDSKITTMTVTNNYGTDALFGVEWDDCQANGSNIGTGILFQNNYEGANVGNCKTAGEAGCSPAGYYAFTNGILNGCNEAGLTMTQNYCTGTSALPSQIGNGFGSGTQPTVSNNTLGPFCTCSNTSPC